MLAATEGIVLSYRKYGENSLIITIYTRNAGRQSYILNASKSGKKRSGKGSLQPLYLVELVAYYKESREIQRIKEIRNNPVYQNIPFDIHRSSQALFIAEILNKTLREQESSPPLFDFIKNSLIYMDLSENHIPNFHLYFLFRLTEYLGFLPDTNKLCEDGWFDLQKGSVEKHKPVHVYYLDKEATKAFCSLAGLKLREIDDIKISRTLRISLTLRLLDYYQLHFEHLGEIRSLKILREVFS
jgi:DNA repair protein RecO (recombination protein O)